MPAEVTIRADQRTFDSLARAMEREASGRMRRDLADELEDAVDPAVHEVRAALMGMQAGGLGHAGEPLRAAVAAGIQDRVILTGRTAGVKVIASSLGMPRGFWRAPKRLNARGWSHPVFGRRNVTVRQVGAPGFFDDTLERHRAQCRAAVARAMQKSVNRIERKA